MVSREQRTVGAGAFARGVGLLTMAIGAVAILGPEAAHAAATQTVGILLVSTGALGVVSLATRGPGAPRKAIWTWSTVAVVVGVALVAAPRHGLASAGVLVGALLLGHGASAVSVVLRRWRSPDAMLIAGSLLGSFFAMVGLALLAGENLGDRVEGIVIGADMVMFGGYLLLGRQIVGAPASAGRSPSTSSR